MRHPVAIASLVLVAVAAAAPVVTAGAAGAVPGAFIPEAAPSLAVTPVMTGLSNAWDTAFAPDGAMFVTERAGQIRVRRPNGTTGILTANLTDLWASGETGIMGIDVDPGFASNRRLYTCQGTTDVVGGATDGTSVQVVAWSVDAGYTNLTRTNDPLVGGIDGVSGRHGGCQLRVDGQGFLRVGTGDAAVGTYPQDRSSLAGKTLRVDRNTGAGAPGNPFLGGGGDPRVFTFGHRNVQGVAIHPVTGEAWSAEHGPDSDDEVNRLVAGGNYGWNPVPGYNETVPMTDVAEFPAAVTARWSSGFPTVATSGLTFLQGSHWGPWQGALAVSTLKGSALRIMRLDGAGNVVGVDTPPELNGTFGRLRSAEMGPCGVLYLTTDAGGGGSQVLAVSPIVDLSGPGAVGVGEGQLAASRCDPVSGQVQLRTTTGGAWQPWTPLGGIAASEPDLASWAPGRLDVFVLGLDSAVHHRAGTVGGAFDDWESLGGRFTSAPSAVSWSPGRVDVFGRGLDGAVWTTYWTGSSWVPWYSLGGTVTSAPDAAAWGNNRWDLFARGTDGAMWHKAWTGSGFTPWSSTGGSFTSGPGAVSWSTGRIDAFGRGLDGSVWSTYWNGSGWVPWYSLGGGARSAPDAASRGPGTWEVLVEGNDGQIWSRSWTGSALTAWSRLP